MKPLICACLAAVVALGPTLLCLGAETPSPRAGLAFKPVGEEFIFDTGLLSGRLRAEKRGLGLTSVKYSSSGQTLSRSTGLLGVYRVFGNGKRFGTAAWDWPSEASLQPDGSVIVKCAATPERPFAFQGTYQWVDRATLELEIQVAPQKDLAHFEAFVSSYFDPAFTNSLGYVRALPGKPNQPGWLHADRSLGEWLMFPRDKAAVALIQDGRWTLEPNPVKWIILPELAYPLGVRRAPAAGLSAIVMAPGKDCFALATPYETEGHYSTYLSLFGRDLKAGDLAKTKVRLQFLDTLDERRILEAYEVFRKGLAP